MKRILSLLLVLVLSFSMLPVFAAASGDTPAPEGSTETTENTESTESTEETKPEEKPKTFTVKVKVICGTKTLYTYDVKVGDKDVKLSDAKFVEHSKKTYKYSVYKVGGKKTHKVTIPAYDGSEAWEKKWGKAGYIQVVYTTHKHKYKPGYNRIYHWSICECGKTTNEVRHVDPANDHDKICTCGYQFNNNAQITTLWFDGVELSPRFTKDITEYTGETVTWKDITSTSITAKPFDALAKIQMPEDLTIREGANKFEFLVTAEDKTTTQTYTVVVIKPVKVDNIFITTDTDTVSVDLKVLLRNQSANASLTDAAAAKIVELAAADQAKQIALCPDFSKWGPPKTEITLTAAQMNTLTGQSTADLLVKTPWEITLTIPHADLAVLAEDYETLTLRVNRDETFAILTDGEEVTLPGATTAEKVPETQPTEPVELITEAPQ